MNNIAKGIKETVNPKGGQGMVESIVILIIVIAVVYMNIQSIEIDPIVGNGFALIAGWLFGRNTKGSNDDYDNVA